MPRPGRCWPTRRLARRAAPSSWAKTAASDSPWTKPLWIYDLRTNKHFTLKTNPLTRADLNEFVARDKTSLDIFWRKDDSLADSDNLPAPGVIALEIVEDLQAALEQFKLIAADLDADVAETVP